jgi:hypothetical protein
MTLLLFLSWPGELAAYAVLSHEAIIGPQKVDKPRVLVRKTA